jgi:hypothetical protein
MQPCVDLPYPDDETMGGMLQYNIAVIRLYGQCGLKLAMLQKWILKNN